MKTKIIFILLFCSIAVFSQSISYWDDSKDYERNKDVVLFQGIRYYPAMNNNLDERPDAEDSDYWERLVPLRMPIITTPQLRLLPKAHEKFKDILTELDGFVKGVESHCNSGILKKISKVALTREKEVVGSALHNSWGDFMVSKTEWNKIKKGQHENNPDTLRSIVTRTYNRYKNLYLTGQGNFMREEIDGLLFVGTGNLLILGISRWIASEGRIGAYEQIAHNIGDASVAFAHALDGYLPPSDKRDIREAGNEFAVKKLTNSQSERHELKRNYFTGSIYDAIAEYGIRTIDAINWAKNNIKNGGSCHKLSEALKNDNCYHEYESKFNILVKGQGDPIWGVAGSAIAVGRAILIDAMLAEKPLEHERIFGPSFLKPDTNYTFTAYARDPDAVVLIRTGTQLSVNAKRIIHTVEDGDNGSIIDYELWHEPSAHPMYYEWFIGENRFSPGPNVESVYNRLVEKRDSLKNMSDSLSVKEMVLNSKEIMLVDKEKELRYKEFILSSYENSDFLLNEISDLRHEIDILKSEISSLKTEVNSLRQECNTLLSTYNSLYSQYFASIKSPNMDLKVILPQELSLDSLKKGANVKIGIRGFGYQQIHQIELKNSTFELSARIIDDEGDVVVAKKSMTFLDRLPVANMVVKRTDSPKHYITKVNEKITSNWEHIKNSIDNVSGFSDTSCYNPIYFDAFGKSIDPDGNASDQIRKSVYYFGNDSIVLSGVNQQYVVDNKIQGQEERVVVNNSLFIKPEEDNYVKAYAEEHFINSIWENDSSPIVKVYDLEIASGEDYKFLVKIYDNEASFSIDTVDLPVLVPPTIKSVELSTHHLINDVEIGEIYDYSPIILEGQDMVIRFYAEAFDPDNGENAEENLSGIESYFWGIREVNSNNEINFSNTDLLGQLETFTYRELLELDLGIKPGGHYEVFVKAEDDDKNITGNAYGFAIMKAGEFKLAPLLTGDKNFDGFVDEWDLEYSE
ncbi:MAG: hypothetical protein LBH98_04105 [Chitinispirillales bacterium]|jgi:hypothetical protein|nr:hypothetical protein [Chitinispirillales bacterium]